MPFCRLAQSHSRCKCTGTWNSCCSSALKSTTRESFFTLSCLHCTPAKPHQQPAEQGLLSAGECLPTFATWTESQTAAMQQQQQVHALRTPALSDATKRGCRCARGRALGQTSSEYFVKLGPGILNAPQPGTPGHRTVTATTRDPAVIAKPQDRQ